MDTRKRRIWVAAIITVVIIFASAAVVYAYLSSSAGSVTNDFTADQATQPSISEDFSETEMRDVTVDVGDPGYAVYVRVAIVTTWQKNGSIHWKTPEGSQVSGVGDYYLDWNETDWFYCNGYYYLKTMVNSGETPNIINLCFQQKPAPDTGYSLNIEIVSQTIQALGGTDQDNTPAVTDAWKDVIVNSDGTLSAKTP